MLYFSSYSEVRSNILFSAFSFYRFSLVRLLRESFDWGDSDRLEFWLEFYFSERFDWKVTNLEECYSKFTEILSTANFFKEFFLI